MSETASTEPETPAAVAAPTPDVLDLGSLTATGEATILGAPQSPNSSPAVKPVNPNVRRALAIIGSMLNQQMVAKDMAPDAVAAIVGMDELTMLRVLTGSAPKVTFAELSSVADALDCFFAPTIQPKAPASPPK